MNEDINLLKNKISDIRFIVKQEILKNPIIDDSIKNKLKPYMNSDKKLDHDFFCIIDDIEKLCE